jgi:hypothetical protein
MSEGEEEMAANGKGKVSTATVVSGDEQRRIRAERRKQKGQFGVADWGSADASKLLRAIERVSGSGFAFMCGYTRDRGSYTIRVVGDEDAEPVYVRATEEIDLALDGIAEIYE